MTLGQRVVVGAVISLTLSACGEDVAPQPASNVQDSEIAEVQPTPDVPDTGPVTTDVVVPECTDDADDNRCDDSDACTVDSCVGGVCTYTPREDACLVEGDCIEDGEASPANACLVCDVSVATDALQIIQCEDDNPCTINSCDEATGCDFSEPDDEASCDDGRACSSDDRCEAGECVGQCVCEIDSDCDGQLALSACERAECVAFDCVVTSDPSKDGEPCGGGLCLTEGQCDAGLCIGEGDKDCSSAADGLCRPGLCNAETGACETGEAIDGTACTDANACTNNDQCISGECVGTEKDCSSFDGTCTSGLCQEGTCVGEIQEGQSCDPDNACFLDATCSETGACLGSWDSTNCPCQEDSNCDDGLSCTTDQCDVDSSACVFTLLADACAIDGACYAGQETNPDNACRFCDPTQSTTSWSAIVCDDDNACTNDTCTDGVCGAEADDSLSCDDGDACTQNDHCEAGECVGTCECELDADCADLSLPVPPNQCEIKACVDFQCVVVPDVAKEGEACDDGLACTLGESCSAGACTGGDDVVCEDSNGPCTTNACSEQAGGCTIINMDAGEACDDSDPCTDDDVCDNDGGCAGLEKDCSDVADQCNAAQCDSGACVQVPAELEGADCSDGQACTVGDSCVAGSCTGSWDDENAACDCNGDDSFCDDGLACTTNTCATDGSCVTTIQSGFCTIANACFENGALNPQNPCQFCDATASIPTTWTLHDAGTECTGAGNACSPGVCSDSGACAAVAVPEDFVLCEDSDDSTFSDWWYDGCCTGFTRISQTDQMGDTEYIKASKSSQGGVHALFKSNECTEVASCNVDLDRYADSGTLQQSWTVGGTFLQVSWAIAETLVLSGPVLREFIAESQVWSLGNEASPESGLASAWGTYNDLTIDDEQTIRMLQFSAVKRRPDGDVYAFGAGPVTISEDGEETLELQSVVRVCSEYTISIPFGNSFKVWGCLDEPVRAFGWTSGSTSTAVNYKDCPGFGEVDGTLFLGCNWYDDLTTENFYDVTDDDVEDRDIVAYNPELEEWRYRTWSSGDGKALKGFTAAGNRLIGVGLKGTLLVSTVTDGVPSEAVNVALSDFDHQDITHFQAVTVHKGQVWAVGAYKVTVTAGEIKRLILVHADVDADLNDGANWHIKTIQTRPTCALDVDNPTPCGNLDTDFTFKAITGDSDGLYIFGTWFDETSGEGGQRNRTIWYRPMP